MCRIGSKIFMEGKAFGAGLLARTECVVLHLGLGFFMKQTVEDP